MIRLSWLCLPWLLLQNPPLAAEDAEPVAAEMRVARAQFTTAIVDREPVDRVAIITPPRDALFFFTDLRNMQGHTITHRWEYKGEVVSQTVFEVDGPRWRVYSKKVLDPGTYGEWSVTVLDETGWPWYVELFRHDPPANRPANPGVGVSTLD